MFTALSIVHQTVMAMKLFFPVLLLLIGIICNAQSGTDLAAQRLKGKVKSVTVNQLHRYKKSEVFTPWAKSYRQVSNFNNKGLLTEYYEFEANDSLSYRIAYNYISKEKKAEVTYFDKTGKAISHRIHTYDGRGNKIEEVHYTPGGQQERRYTYAYDNRGNMIEMINHKKDSTVYSKSTWKYDGNNNKIEYLLETPGYASSTWKYKYDDKGNNTEETWIAGKTINFRFERTYDVHGNVVKEVKYKDDKLLDTSSKTYTYDAKGNWIKRVELTSKGEDYHIDERTIIYY